MRVSVSQFVGVVILKGQFSVLVEKHPFKGPALPFSFLLTLPITNTEDFLQNDWFFPPISALWPFDKIHVT